MLLSLLPQIHLWIVRGRDWNSAYVSPHVDEPLYSAYINALIDGRTRKNDPYGGKDNSTSAPLLESTFSTQFVPAYLVALPARIFNLSSAGAFIVLAGVSALLATISVFWLIDAVTGDHRVAAAGTLFTLCLGCVVGKFGVFGTFVDVGIAAFPFLRRYQPAAAFPLFFAFQLLVWKALTSQSKRSVRVSAVGAGLTLAILVFSYFYLWTGAAAWLACFGVLWLCFLPSDRRRVLGVLATIAGIAVLALGPYLYLVSRRSRALDEQLTVISTHWPDVWRLYEILGAVILVALVIGVLRRRIEAHKPQVIYAGSLALLPFIVFNQQVLTGKTMQAFHYEIFIVNYSTLIGLIISCAILWEPIPRRLVLWLAGLSLVWGTVVVGLPARVAFVPAAIASDLRIPVLLRLKELSKQDGTLTDLRTKGQTPALVFSPSVPLITQLPTWTSQGTLLDLGGVDFGTLTREERKKLFFMHLYYSNTPPEVLRQALRGPADSSHEELATVRTVIFGYERTSPALTFQFKPIQEDEIEREVSAYETYEKSFSRDEVLQRPFAYAVIDANHNFNYARLDRWYERDPGERVGDYTLYRLRLRN